MLILVHIELVIFSRDKNKVSNVKAKSIFDIRLTPILL
ncbi:hypothetical protein SAMN05443667_10748 [Flavobacterium gillisiae]|uniref:Uncharacterized protein n=1 Tax=Flavobacterium gillisiae TaxID=150146 RepID=A0A1H4D4P9_9FLAO|nr:hypothetical protein SAMN05443667_10748 [Flavobacterium gillisiae]